MAGGAVFIPLFSDSSVTYAWDFGDGNTSSAMFPSHTYSANGVYFACLTITDGAGCSDTYCDSVLYPVTFPGGGGTGGGTGGGNPGGGGTGGGGGNFPGPCDAMFFAAGDTSLLIDLFPFNWDSTLTYSWDFGDGNTSSQMYPQHTYTTQGTYTICLIVSDASQNCADTICQQIAVQQLTGPWGPGTGSGGPWNPGGGPGSGGNWGACDAFFMPLTDSSRTADFFPAVMDSMMIYSWDFGDGATSSSMTPTHTYGAPGAYIVCLTVTGQSIFGPCTASFCQTVVVPFDSTLCGPWNPGYGYLGGGNGGPIIITPSGGGPMSPCSAMFMPFPDTIPLSYYFVRLPLDTTIAYSWDFGDGTTSADVLPNHLYSAPGTYPVCLTVTGNGCTDTFCDTITVTNATWTGGSFAPVSLGESSIQYQNAYPNPTIGQLQLNFASDRTDEVSMRVIDMSGRTLLDTYTSTREGQNQEQLDLSGVPAGTYILQVIQGSSVDYLRIVKQ